MRWTIFTTLEDGLGCEQILYTIQMGLLPHWIFNIPHGHD